MNSVRPRGGGIYSLFCYKCRRWIPNTANPEMRKEGVYSYSHFCHEGKLLIGDEGIAEEKGRKGGGE